MAFDSYCDNFLVGLCLSRTGVGMSSGDTLVVTAVPIGSVLVVGAASYLLYKNRFTQPADAKGRMGYKGPGEFFVGGFFGGSFVPGTDWTYRIAGHECNRPEYDHRPRGHGWHQIGLLLG